VDVRVKVDIAFWLHLAAALSITGGMYFWLTDNGYEWAMLCAVSVALLLVSVFLQRSVYTVFGAVGVASYLGYLSFEIFKDTLLFSFVLSGIGVLLMTLGYLYFKHERDLQAWIERNLPHAISRLRPHA
jgi:hypothetical protein